MTFKTTRTSGKQTNSKAFAMAGVLLALSVAGLAQAADLSKTGAMLPGELTDPTVAMLPGYLTDPSAQKPVETKEFAVPEEVRYPYVSTYYVKPVVAPSEAVSIKAFVTDWNNSKVRLGDDSHRFTITLRLTADGGKTYRTQTIEDVASGDHVFKLGKLTEGDYRVGVFCTDEKNRPSHTVWQVFRVKGAVASKTRTLSLDDLAAYGIVPEKDRYSYVDVDIAASGIGNEADPTNLEGVKDRSAAMHEKVLKIVKEKAAGVTAPDHGYVVVRPVQNGEVTFYSWCRSVVIYGKSYDKAAVAAESESNLQGLQKLIDESVAQGVARLVLPKDAVVRVSQAGLRLPSDFTLDLNGATLKMNGFTGAKADMVKMENAHDTHLVNGIVEGDYYEHDYAGSSNDSEWVQGVVMLGDCQYSTCENLVIRNISGYGAGNGLMPKDHVFPGFRWITKTFEPGALDRATGEVVADAPYQFTTTFHDLSRLTEGWVAVSRFLGYQGIATRSWYYTIAFYDADKKFLASQVGFQYRPIPIPPGAKFLRVTMTEEDLEKMNGNAIAMMHCKVPLNCAFKKVRFERCRAVGLAQSAMRNMLVEDCEFTASGDTLATCAYDAEDGWDMMHDVYIHRNKFFNNPMNELLTCAGHNFMIEDNDANIHLWGRTMSAVVRNNRGKTGWLSCDNQVRTMHGRYENNTFTKKLNVGERGRGEDDWTIAISGTITMDKGASLILGQTGVLRDATVRDLTLHNPRCENVRLIDCTVKSGSGNAVMLGCELVNSKVDSLSHTGAFERCSFVTSTISPLNAAHVTFRSCAFTNSTLFAGWWMKPSYILLRDCTVKSDGETFLRIPVYAIDKLLFANTTFDCGTRSPVEICDLRKNQFDAKGEFETQTAKVAFKGCTIAAAEVPLLTAPRNGAKPSEKPVKIYFDGNTAANGANATIIDPALVHTTWKLVK